MNRHKQTKPDEPPCQCQRCLEAMEKSGQLPLIDPRPTIAALQESTKKRGRRR